MSNQEKLNAIREQIPSLQHWAFFNTGTAGPLPGPVHRAMLDQQQEDLFRGRASIPGFEELKREMEETRQKLAALLGAEEEEIALTQHTTEGINIVLWGLRWTPEDEILTTNAEHAGVAIPLAQLRRRTGVTIRYVPIDLENPGETLSRFERAITPRTRMIALSHVSYSTGTLLPLQELVQLARDKNLLVLVDGAQTVGAIPLNLHELQADFYAFPAQKWLLGPEGGGGLYIRRTRIPEVEPTYVGYMSTSASDPQAPYYLPAPNARRYEVGTVHRPVIAGFRRAVEFFCEEVGPDWAYRRIRELARQSWHTLSSLPGVRMLSEAEPEAGLVHFYVEGRDPKQLVVEAEEQGIILRDIPGNGALRISTGYFNNQEDLDRLYNWLEQVAQK